MTSLPLAATALTICLLELCSFAVVLKQQEDPMDVVSKSLQAANQIKTWQADFVQTRMAGGKKTVKKGRIYYSRPGKLALKYSQPEEIHVAIDGNRVTAYYPARKSAEQISVPFPGNLSEVFQFTDGLMAAQLLYDISWANDRSSKYYPIEFTPRLSFPLEPNLAKFRTDYDRQTLLPVGVWLFNNAGEWIQYEFVGAENNKTIAPEVFTSTPPAGTRMNNVSDLRQLLTGLFTERR